MFTQRGELPLLPSGNPIGFVPASRGGVYIESMTTGDFGGTDLDPGPARADDREQVVGGGW